MPYKPLDLNEINNNFSENINSGEQPESNEPISNTFSPVPENPVKVGGDYTVTDIAAILSGNFSDGENPVFHDLPDYDKETTEDDDSFLEEIDEENGNNEEQIYESFPEIDVSVKQSSAKERIKAEKINSRDIIKDEKRRIKDQKHIERKVQKPFKKRKTFAFLFVVFFIVGLLLTAVTALGIGQIQSVNGLMKIQDYALFYVNTENDELYNNYLVLNCSTDLQIQGSKHIVFTDTENNYKSGTVSDFTVDYYRVSTLTGIERVEKSQIQGITIYSIPKMKTIHGIFEKFSIIIVVGVTLYFSLLIAGFSVVISKLNKKIKKIKAEYEFI